MTVLVGQVFGPDHKYHQWATTRHWTGEASLARMQPKVPLRREHDRDLREVGRLIHLQDGADGCWAVFEVTDPTFRAIDERRFLSAGWSKDFASGVEGAHVRYDKVMLSEISLVEKPGVWTNTEVQLDATDPRTGRGGHSYTTTPHHRKVLDSAADWLEARPAMRRSDFVNVYDPGAGAIRKRTRTTEQVIEESRRHIAEQAAAKTTPSRGAFVVAPPTRRRAGQVNERIDEAFTTDDGRTVHRRFFPNSHLTIR